MEALTDTISDPWKAYTLIDRNASEPDNTDEGMAGRISNYGTGLRLGRHKRHGYYALIWFPGVQFEGWSVPLVDEEPEVVVEFTGRFQRQPGPWMIEFIRKHDFARQYPSLEAYIKAERQRLRDQLARRRETGRVRRREDMAEVMDKAYTLERGRRTIVCGWTPDAA